jgi:hypothetical protein
MAKTQLLLLALVSVVPSILAQSPIFGQVGGVYLSSGGSDTQRTSSVEALTGRDPQHALPDPNVSSRTISTRRLVDYPFPLLLSY